MDFPGDREEVPRLVWRPTPKQYLREVTSQRIGCQLASKVYDNMDEQDLRLLEQLGRHLLDKESVHDPSCAANDPGSEGIVVTRLAELRSRAISTSVITCARASELDRDFRLARFVEVDESLLEQLVQHVAAPSEHEADCSAFEDARRWKLTGTCWLYRFARERQEPG